VTIYLVRHAQAGKRDHWRDDDQLRPLTEVGHEQAVELAMRFDSVAVPQVLSSPYLRCMQTLEPLARRKGLEVEPTGVLAEGHAFVAVIDLLLAVPEHTVLCSHGDVIPETIEALCRRGMDVDGMPDWRKGTTWLLERDGDRFTHASVWAPPLRDPR